MSWGLGRDKKIKLRFLSLFSIIIASLIRAIVFPVKNSLQDVCLEV